MTLDDTPLVERLEPFESFFRREYRPVLGLAAALTGNVQVAEDLTQDAFMATLRDWDRVGRLENPGGWVRKIVANRSVSLFRKGVAEVRALIRYGASDMDHASLQSELSIDTWREVRRLPARQAQAIVLTYLLDTPRREVARILGCSEETVKTHLERARKRLAANLSDGSDL